MSSPSSASSHATACPVRPGAKPTRRAGASRARATRATLTPLPPGVTATSSNRSTSPGRSSSIVSVRSIVRFGPAMSMRCGANYPSAVRVASNRACQPRCDRGGGGGRASSVAPVVKLHPLTGEPLLRLERLRPAERTSKPRRHGTRRVRNTIARRGTRSSARRMHARRPAGPPRVTNVNTGGFTRPPRAPVKRSPCRDFPIPCARLGPPFTWRSNDS